MFAAIVLHTLCDIMKVKLKLNLHFFLQTSYRGRKALNLGGVVSPRAKQQKAANSPVPATVPQQSPNTATNVNQQQTNLIGITTTQITAQQPQQQTQQTNILQIPTTTTQIMKEHHQQPMVSFFLSIN